MRDCITIADVSTTAIGKYEIITHIFHTHFPNNFYKCNIQIHDPEPRVTSYIFNLTGREGKNLL